MDIPKRLKEEEIKSEDDIRDISEESDNKEKEINNISDLVLVHLTNYIPEGGVIRTPKDAGATLGGSFMGHKLEIPRERNTVHFTINGEVTNNTGGSFKGRKYAIIIPLKNIDKEKIAGGNLADIYTEGSLQIPEGSYILCPNPEQIEGQIGDKLQAVEYETTEETKAVDGYANLLISKLGYKVEGVGEDVWSNQDDTSKAQSILKEEGYLPNGVIRHSDSKFRKSEFFLEANKRKKKNVKILLENEINMDYPEDNIYQISRSKLAYGTTINYKETEYIEDLYEKLKQIGLEIPESVKKEIESISKGNFEKTEEMEELDSRVKDNFDLDDERCNLPGFILKRRIIGEIELKKIANKIKESPEKKELIGVLKLLKEKGIDYTTGDRKIEFLQELGINISDMESTILKNKNLLKMYIHILEIKDVPFSELSEKDQALALEFKNVYERSGKKCGDYYIGYDYIEKEDGTAKYCFQLINSKNNFNLSQEEIKKLGNEIIGEGKNTGKPVLDFDMAIKPEESVAEYCRRYEEYKNKVLNIVEERENEPDEKVPVDKLGKETLEEQKDTKRKKDMEGILYTRMQEFTLKYDKGSK